MTNAPHNPTGPATNDRPIRRRRRWAPVLLALAMLITGTVAGVAATTYYLTERFHLRPRDPSTIPDHIVDRMRRKLDLTDQQADDVRRILDTHFQEMMALREQIKPQMKAGFESMESDVAAVLSPEQAAEWRQWCRKRFAERWNRYGGKHRGAHPDGRPPRE